MPKGITIYDWCGHMEDMETVSVMQGKQPDILYLNLVFAYKVIYILVRNMLKIEVWKSHPQQSNTFFLFSYTCQC